MGQFKLFSLIEGVIDEEQTQRDNRDVAHPLGRWEKWYTEKWIDALVQALSQPVRSFGPEASVAYEVNHIGDKVVLERLVRLMQINKRHQERFEAAELEGASPEDVSELYRILGHDWKEPTQEMTNWEVCMLMMELSLRAPLGRDAYEEYKRAFAHCFGIETYRSVFRDELLRVDACRHARWNEPRKHRLPPLDADERAWIARFNEALKGGTSLADELFKAEVFVR